MGRVQPELMSGVPRGGGVLCGSTGELMPHPNTQSALDIGHAHSKGLVSSAQAGASVGLL